MCVPLRSSLIITPKSLYVPTRSTSLYPTHIGRNEVTEFVIKFVYISLHFLDSVSSYVLKIEAKSFRDARQDILRIQKVIWDHLLAFKGEVIQKQALFSLPFRTPNSSRVVLIYAVCSVDNAMTLFPVLK